MALQVSISNGAQHLGGKQAPQGTRLHLHMEAWQMPATNTPSLTSLSPARSGCVTSLQVFSSLLTISLIFFSTLTFFTFFWLWKLTWGHVAACDVRGGQTQHGLNCVVCERWTGSPSQQITKYGTVPVECMASSNTGVRISRCSCGTGLHHCCTRLLPGQPPY